MTDSRAALPHVHPPKQEALLEVAVNLGIKPIVLEIVGLIRGRKPISRPVRARLKEIEAMYAG